MLSMGQAPEVAGTSYRHGQIRGFVVSEFDLSAFGPEPEEVQELKKLTVDKINEMQSYGVHPDPFIIQTRIESLIQILSETGVIDYWAYQSLFMGTLDGLLSDTLVQIRRSMILRGDV